MTSLVSEVRSLALAGMSGLLWGAAVTAMETLSQPTQALPVRDLLALVRSIAWTWALSGLWWAVIALPLAILPARRLMLLIPPLALAITLVHWATWTVGLNASLQGGSRELMGLAPQPEAVFFHVLWANLFYGGLYLLGFAGYKRVWHSRRLLAEMGSSHAEVDAIQQEERLRALRGQLQPEILVDALETLQSRYRDAPAQAEPLFDQIIRFLRIAMHSLRGRRATLSSELTLVHHYAELRRQIGTSGGAKSYEDASPSFDGTFPALCLLPLVEELSRDLPLDIPLTIRRTAGADWAAVQLDVPCRTKSIGNNLECEAERRMRLELAALYGSAANLVLLRGTQSTSVQIRIPAAIFEASVGQSPHKEVYP